MNSDQRKNRLLRHYNQQLGRCFYCGVDAGLGGPIQSGRQATIDHVVPRSRGGTYRDGFVMACASCNSRKATKTLEEYRLHRGFSTGRFGAFALESLPVQRDYLGIASSPPFVATLVAHNS
jgi:hypothetical protein